MVTILTLMTMMTCLDVMTLRTLYIFAISLLVRYERLFPVFNRTIVTSPNPDEPYTNPKAPVHITTGSAGCREKHDGFIPNPPQWSAVRSSQYGFTRMMVANATHIHLEQVDVETEGLPVVDSFWLVQHNHGPFTNLL